MIPLTSLNGSGLYFLMLILLMSKTSHVEGRFSPSSPSLSMMFVSSPS